MAGLTGGSVLIRNAPDCAALQAALGPEPAAPSDADRYWRHQRLLLAGDPAVTILTAGDRSVVLTDLPWDTERFGFACARLEPLLPAAASDLPPSLALAALDRARDRGCRLVHARFPFAAREALAALVRAGAAVVDRQVTLLADAAAVAAGAGPAPAGWAIRPAAATDTDAIAAWLPGAFTHTRFVADPQFPAALVAPLYRAWFEHALAAPAKTVLVLAPAGGGAPVGFCIGATAAGAGRSPGRPGAAIDLVAVAPAWRGRRFGRLLTARTAAVLARAADRLEVRTQIDNSAALTAFVAAGFRSFTPGVTLPAGVSAHWWSDRVP